MNEEKKHILFIVNPISGIRGKTRIHYLINNNLDKEKFSWEIIKTKKAGHAIEIADQAVRNEVDIVAAVGGDGTVNEVARSLVHTHTALGIIPCGSGNGLARHLQIPMEPRKAIKALNAGSIHKIDYGKINDTPFFCTCGFGFDAFVSLRFANAGKRGMLTYLEKALQEYLTYTPEMYELKIEDINIRHKAFLIACGNAAQYGNNAYITPQATITDGLLDVTILEPFTLLDVPNLAFQLFNKTLHQNNRIKTFKCKTLYVHRDKPGVIHFDGDPMVLEKDVKIEIIQESLNVIIPCEKDCDTNVLQKASDYLAELKTMNGLIMENLVERNKQRFFNLSSTKKRIKTG
ncbi:putative lipid kinase YegS [termite gut metagenome]|uniref:Putative lipid kinase YegS n=1 Tax=termite gut metagenome TaxID=433724 RepID=A0A5J4S651_9ZZZZ